MSNNKLKIYPVIEMSPWRVDGGDDLNLREGQDYSDFALEVFRNHGITNISRLDEHAYSSIKISDINDSDLKILIEKELDDADIPENGTEIVGAFSGGLVVIIDDIHVIHHQCCGSISDYINWAEFLEKLPSEWSEIWIGHPWVYGRIRNGRIELSDYIEHTDSLDEENLVIKTDVDLNAFSEEYANAIFELRMFKERILTILTTEMSEIAIEVTELLIENEFHGSI
jgi:hypothetical protein